MDFVSIVNAETKPVPVKITGEGITVNGGISGANVSDGSHVDGVSYELDENSYPVLRVVDAAPFAYDPALQVIKTTVLAQRKVVKEKLTKSDEVAPNGTQTIEIKPPIGKVWRIENISFNMPAPVGATSGTHQISFYYGEDVFYCNVLQGSTAFNKVLSYIYGAFASTVDAKTPEDVTLQTNALKGLYVTSLVPLYVKYQNKTDVSHNAARHFYVVYTEEDSL